MTALEETKVGIVGTSRYAQGMFYHNLKDHPFGFINAICGHNPEKTKKTAEKWNIPFYYTNYNEMIGSGNIDALIVASPNYLHYPITMKALESNIHVMCEKPLAMDTSQAQKMTDLAKKKNLITMVPFTHYFKSTYQYLKLLFESNTIGNIYHCYLRYHADYGLNTAYQWRFDKEKAGSGALFDLGSHFIFLAYWFFGPIKNVFCRLETRIEREKLNPEGKNYEFADDYCLLNLSFEKGLNATLDISTIANQVPAYTQIQEMDFFGSKGTLHSIVDVFKRGNQVNKIRKTTIDTNETINLEIPNSENEHTLFSEQNTMGRLFVDSVHKEAKIMPDFDDGLYVQKILNLALLSNNQQKVISL